MQINPNHHSSPLTGSQYSGGPLSSPKRTNSSSASASQFSLLTLNEDAIEHFLKVVEAEHIKTFVNLSRSCKEIRNMANSIEITDAPKKILDYVINGGIDDTLKTTFLNLREKYNGFSPPFQYKGIKDIGTLKMAIKN